MVWPLIAFCREEQTVRDSVQHAVLKATLNKSTLEQMPEPAAKAAVRYGPQRGKDCIGIVKGRDPMSGF